MLLRAKADLYYVNRRLWTAPRFMFDPDLPNENRCEFFDICVSFGFTEWNQPDCRDWTILHRAAAFGCAEDITKLLQLGAFPMVYTSRFQWLPIQCAVRFNNLSTFRVLTNFFPPLELISLTDIRGWTLLHLAAYQGSSELIANLLHIGLDPKAESSPSTLWVPKGIEHVKATPLEIAKACDREDVYLKAFELFGTGASGEVTSAL